MKQGMLLYAIIGMGFIYPRHVEAIKQTGGRVFMTCDIDSTKKPDWIHYRNMFNSAAMEKVDAVVICAPNYLHAEMIRDALRIGKRVLCEKPLTINTDFTFMDGVNVVLQLRYHPKYNEIVKKLGSARKVKLVMRAFRDEAFWNSWKGDESKSGGVVYILGAHIFDLLLCGLSGEYQLKNVKDTMKKSTGQIYFNNTEVEFDLEFLDSTDGQTRHIEIDGERFVLSLKDNLSFEMLHHRVYESFISGICPTLEDVKPSIELIDKIKKCS